MHMIAYAYCLHEKAWSLIVGIDYGLTDKNYITFSVWQIKTKNLYDVQMYLSKSKKSAMHPFNY